MSKELPINQSTNECVAALGQRLECTVYTSHHLRFQFGLSTSIAMARNSQYDWSCIVLGFLRCSDSRQTLPSSVKWYTAVLP